MNIICGWNVANSLIKKSFEEGIYITSLKLNSLVYLLYSNYLFKIGDKLFNELFIKIDECPVLPTIEAKFGCFKDELITKYAKDATGNIIGVSGECFEEELSFIWNKYKNMSDIEILIYINEGNMFRKKKDNEIIDDMEILDDEIKRNEEVLAKGKYNRKKLLNN